MSADDPAYAEPVKIAPELLVRVGSEAWVDPWIVKALAPDEMDTDDVYLTTILLPHGSYVRSDWALSLVAHAINEARGG